MYGLNGAVRSYDWGSRTVIAKMQGRPFPTPTPEAEVWFGAHPGAPAEIDGQSRSLMQVIEADPVSALGPEVAAAFSGRLPFLTKILAVECPLSLQAHPSTEQAIAGFAAENRAGLDLDDPRRNYRDDSAKPEIVVAVTDFVALAGFRPTPGTIDLLRTIDADAFMAAIGVLTANREAPGLRKIFTDWLRMPSDAMATLQRRVLSKAAAVVDGHPRFENELRVFLALGDKYPGDPGVLAALLLNVVRLSPGQALFLPAGNLHAYIRGTAVEAMASSDNVLRGGLTTKHVDVDELLRILTFDPVEPQHLLPQVRHRGAESRYLTPSPEFALSRFDMADPREYLGLDGDGPQILAVVDGDIEVQSGMHPPRRISSGQGLWLSAQDHALSVHALGGPAVFFRCEVGLTPVYPAWRSAATTGFGV